jgi:hypothetical protein
MLREGASLISVSRILGHKNLETTAKYLHSNSEDDRHAVEVLAVVFGRESEKVADGQREDRTGVVSPVSGN